MGFMGKKIADLTRDSFLPRLHGYATSEPSWDSFPLLIPIKKKNTKASSSEKLVKLYNG